MPVPCKTKGGFYMQKVRYGIIGCGNIVSAHLKGIKNVKNAELVAVSDIIEDLAKKTGEANGVEWHKDYKELLKRKDIDAVTICTPSGMHMQHAIDAMRAGKHVLSEKPLEVTLERIDQMIKASEETGSKLACVFQSRFFNTAIKIREAVKQGKLGKMVLGDVYNKWYRSPEYYKSAGWRATWELDGGGALMNQAVHAIDLLIFMMGDVQSVSGYADTIARDLKVEDTAVAILRFKSGALGVIEGTTSVYPEFDRRLELHGAKGSIVLIGYDKITKWHIEGEEDLAGKIEEEKRAAVDPALPKIDTSRHMMQIEAFTNALIEGKQPEVNAYDARKSIEIILAIYKSSKEKREINLPL